MSDFKILQIVHSRPFFACFLCALFNLTLGQKKHTIIAKKSSNSFISRYFALCQDLEILSGTAGCKKKRGEGAINPSPSLVEPNKQTRWRSLHLLTSHYKDVLARQQSFRPTRTSEGSRKREGEVAVLRTRRTIGLRLREVAAAFDFL